MKPNPFVLPLVAVGGVLTLVGVLVTVMSITGGYSFAATLSSVAAVLVAVGAPALVGGVVLAGIDWRLTKSR